ncbi:YigZ family protein [Corynebacterium sp. 153RC1]|uniref:YigZ family protein n=1 Tax=unclassified Corynebacterium TaxID=2624378 RepID=UPI00211CFA27|nr:MULTISPECIES: YigZ family protein [unclassified Corynebacterium]MCQ9351699.1 YigZ family protein [Corynebacterium sp. 209RC1]MCQ9354068.1 YigZ family protein [Corynebacterium sp. 1222RC1]MCQ9355982.1 YigZ family protein [Corynebacterium sp. 122RC1]MCQ9358226.1 YigZ family protein [Corynebacterium sp. 142RC1]MCQ9360170.1 YigZ family protein [Corynebacterium sp. 153RC1]
MYSRPEANTEFFIEHEIKRSRFLCFITQASSEQDARNFVQALRGRYPDARHHCSAFIIHQDGANPMERSSDDGEPSGTAGQPMLDVLRGSGLQDIVAVVVRYFGGTKLGAGGLVHAYSNVVSDCLAQVRTVTRRRLSLFELSLGHADAGRIEAELRARGVTVQEVTYGARVQITLAVPTEPEQKAMLQDLVASLTKGGGVLKEAGHTFAIG